MDIWQPGNTVKFSHAIGKHHFTHQQAQVFEALAIGMKHRGDCILHFALPTLHSIWGNRP
jgi:hypothetical protein